MDHMDAVGAALESGGGENTQHDSIYMETGAWRPKDSGQEERGNTVPYKVCLFVGLLLATRLCSLCRIQTALDHLSHPLPILVFLPFKKVKCWGLGKWLSQ